MVDSTGAILAGEIFAIAIVGIGAIIVIAWTLYKTGTREPRAMVTISLSLLTVMLIGAAAFTENGDLFVPLVGAGVGALAGAVTYQLGGGRERDSKNPSTGECEPPEEQEKP